MRGGAMLGRQVDIERGDVVGHLLSPTHAHQRGGDPPPAHDPGQGDASNAQEPEIVRMK